MDLGASLGSQIRENCRTVILEVFTVPRSGNPWIFLERPLGWFGLTLAIMGTAHNHGFGEMWDQTSCSAVLGLKGG